jgi:hypothetical protein
MSEMTESREIGFSDTSEISLCVIKSSSVSSGLGGYAGAVGLPRGSVARQATGKVLHADLALTA